VERFPVQRGDGIDELVCFVGRQDSPQCNFGIVCGHIQDTLLVQWFQHIVRVCFVRPLKLTGNKIVDLAHTQVAIHNGITFLEHESLQNSAYRRLYKTENLSRAPGSTAEQDGTLTAKLDAKRRIYENYTTESESCLRAKRRKKRAFL
jgi:hypothetical protein